MNYEARLENQRVRDHRSLSGSVYSCDVEVLLDRTPRIGEEGPERADRGAELLQRVVLVGGDGDDLRVRDGKFGLQSGQLEVLLMFLGAVVTPGEGEDQRVDGPAAR